MNTQIDELTEQIYCNLNLNLYLPSAQTVQRNAPTALKVPAGHTAHIGVCGVSIDMEYIPAAHFFVPEGCAEGIVVG